MKRIPLTRGKFAIVDDEDFDYLNQWKWHADESKRRSGPSAWYAARGFINNGKRVNVRMHQAMAKRLRFPKGASDHKNRNGLDNRRHNIRPCNQSQNNGNREKWAACSSRFKGCWWDTKRQKWIVKIMLNGVSHHIGRFKSEHQAGIAYEEAAEILFGEFAVKL